MTILATAPVPRHLALHDADTDEIRLRSPAEQVPPAAPASGIELSAFGAKILAMPLAEQAARYGLSIDQAAKVRDIFAATAPLGLCPDWCAVAGEHEDDAHPADRAHFSDATKVTCTLEPVPAGRTPHLAWAGLVQHAYDRQPRINAHLGAHPIDLTPAEAREYAARLVELADVAEQTGSLR